MPRPTSIALVVIVVLASLAAPSMLSEFNLRLATLSLHSSIAVIGLCIAFGWTGLLHLGQAAFIGIGAYATAILSTRLGLGFWVTMPIALVASGLVALFIAVPMLRLRGHYLALAVLGFNVTFEIVARNWTRLTGGFDGITDIPPVNVFGHRIEGDRDFYFLSLGFVILVTLFGLALRHSRYGRAMIAIRDDELAAGTSSIAVTRMKVLAFVMASMLAGLSGALYAHHATFIAPQDFEFVRSVTILVMLILGGESSVFGAIIGTVILTFLPEWLRFLGDYYQAVFGILVLVILIVMPTGIVGTVTRWWPRLAGRQAKPARGAVNA
jgi:branched-chain amino acid transport system permease protein